MPSINFVIYGFILLLATMVLWYAVSRTSKKWGIELESLNIFLTRYQWWLIGCLFIAYFVTMSKISVLRHEAWHTYAFDLGIFDQAIWNTTKGRFLFSSLKDNICLLGDHMSPALLLYVPFYWIWNDVRILLVAQAFVTALCFFPLAYIAQEKLGRGFFPVLFAVLLFFYQPLRQSVRAEFHPELLANLVSLGAFYFLIKQRMKLFFLALFVLVMCKENMYGISFAFGFYLLLQKRFRLGISLMVLSITLFLITTQLLIPYFRGGDYFYKANYSYLFSGSWGSNPPLIVQPLSLLEYVSRIFLPLGFLSFLHPPTLVLTFPVLFQNLLSRNPLMHSTAFQYTSGLTPFVFISAIYGMQTLIRWNQKKTGTQQVRLGILVFFVLLSLSLIGRPERHFFSKYQSSLNNHKRRVARILQRVPETFSVVATQNLVPHLSHRLQIKQFEDYQRGFSQAGSYPLISDLVILDREVTTGDFDMEVKKIRASGYRVIHEWEGFVILQRKDLDSALIQQIITQNQ